MATMATQTQTQTQTQYEILANELITKKTATYLPILMIDGVRVHCYLKLVCNVSPEHSSRKCYCWPAQSDVGCCCCCCSSRLTLDVCNPTYRFYDDMGQYNPLHNLITLNSTIPVIADELQIVDLIKDIVRQTGELKYDKMRGLKPETGNLDYIAMMDIFTLPNITFNCGKCCVCHVRTSNKTTCGHDLCLHCWAKLPIIKGEKNDDDDDWIGELDRFMCPVCSTMMPEYENQLHIWDTQ